MFQFDVFLTVNMISKSHTKWIYNYSISWITLQKCQDEKPPIEKTQIDVLVKDLMRSQFWFLFSMGIIQFVSLFAPNVPMYDNVYLMSHILLFISNFHIISIFILLYIQHVYVFQPDEFNGVDVSKMRKKSLMWKMFLTVFTISISIIFPIREPIMFTFSTRTFPYT